MLATTDDEQTKQTAQVSSNAKGGIFRSQSYKRMVNGIPVQLYDTKGLHDTASLDMEAIREIYNLIDTLKWDGIHLLIHALPSLPRSKIGFHRIANDAARERTRAA